MKDRDRRCTSKTSIKIYKYERKHAEKRRRNWQKEKWAHTCNCMPWYNHYQHVLTLFCQPLCGVLPLIDCINFLWAFVFMVKCRHHKQDYSCCFWHSVVLYLDLSIYIYIYMQHNHSPTRLGFFNFSSLALCLYPSFPFL